MNQQLWILSPGIKSEAKASGQTGPLDSGNSETQWPFSTIWLLCSIKTLIRRDFLLFSQELGLPLLRWPEKVLQLFMGLASIKEEHKCTKRHKRLPYTPLYSHTWPNYAIPGSYCFNRRTHTGHWIQTSNVGTASLPMTMPVNTDFLSDLLFWQLILLQGKITLQLTCLDEDYWETDCYE